NDDSSILGLKHFAFVLKAKLPSNFSLENVSSELSINRFEFLNKNKLWRRYPELEYWSQLVCENNFGKYKNVSLEVVKKKKKKVQNLIIVTGEIGSGKSEVSNYLKRKKIPVISTREI